MKTSDWIREVGRLTKKVNDQQKQIDEAKAIIETYTKGTEELNNSIDSIMIEVARSFGWLNDEGDTYTVVLPLVSVNRNMRDYEVTAEVGEDNDSYVIRAKKRVEVHDTSESENKEEFPGDSAEPEGKDTVLPERNTEDRTE